MKKVTVPVGVAASAMVTVAVSVTTWPTIAGFGATVSCVVVSIFGLITTTPFCFLAGGGVGGVVGLITTSPILLAVVSVK